jgi:hypothetical protein
MGWVGLVWARPGSTPVKPHRQVDFKPGSAPVGAAYGGRVSVVHGRPRGSRWTESTLLSSLTVHVHQVHQTFITRFSPQLLRAVALSPAASGESSVRWLGDGTHDLHGSARSPGTPSRGLGGELGFLGNLSTMVAWVRVSSDEAKTYSCSRAPLSPSSTVFLVFRLGGVFHPLSHSSTGQGR